MDLLLKMNLLVFIFNLISPTFEMASPLAFYDFPFRKTMLQDQFHKYKTQPSMFFTLEISLSEFIQDLFGYKHLRRPKTPDRFISYKYIIDIYDAMSVSFQDYLKDSVSLTEEYKMGIWFAVLVSLEVEISSLQSNICESLSPLQIAYIGYRKQQRSVLLTRYLSIEYLNRILIHHKEKSLVSYLYFLFDQESKGNFDVREMILRKDEKISFLKNRLINT